MKHKLLRMLTLILTLPLLLVFGIPPDSGETPLIIEGSRKRPWRNAGVPTDGVSGTYATIAAKGDLLIDTTNGTIYQNTNTLASPTWTQLTASTVAYGLVADMAANGTAAANAVGVSASASRVDHVHKIGVHDHSDNTKGSPIVEAGIAAASLTGLVAKVVADGNVIGGIPVVHRVAMAGGATATVNVLLTHKTRVTDVRVIKKAAGTTSDTITVKNVSTAITDAISIAGGDKTIARAGTIDDAQWDVDAGTNLAVTETDGGGNDSPACEVMISGIRVA
jgi:hypothetical protein